jgi:alpha-tubulin suppressor-like RCC1 family protein
MDMSGLAGLAAQEELEEIKNSRTQTSTLSVGTAEGMVGVESTFSMGVDHSCAVMDNNTVWCWGSDGQGQLGNYGNSSNQHTPVQVDFTAYTGNNAYYSSSNGYFGDTVIEVSVGQEFSCARTDDGAAVCWGSSGNLQTTGISNSHSDLDRPINPVPLPGLVTSITTGEKHACAILQDDGHNIENGSVYCWGYAYYGQMGDGSTSPESSTVGQVSLPSGSEALQIVAGNDHTCAIMSNDSIYCWGKNSYGQLGDGTQCQSGIFTNGCNGNNAKTLPTKVSLPSIVKPIQISAGDLGTCIVSFSKDLYCWGYHHFVYDGSGYPLLTPTEMSFNVNGNTGPSGEVIQVAIPFHSTSGMCILLSSNEVECWGDNGNYRLGVVPEGWLYNYGNAVNQDLPSGATISSINLGIDHGCRSLSNSTIQCWGYNGDGRAGVGNTSLYIPAPSIVTGNHLLLLSNLDDDGDGVNDIFDGCPTGLTGWTSTPTTDNDGDGCQDSSEDIDDDNDGYSDSDDAYPLDASFYQNLTMSDGWIVGGRYENVSISCGSVCSNPANLIIYESSSGSLSDPLLFGTTTYQSFSSGGSWAIGLDGQPINLNGLMGPSTVIYNWTVPTTSSAIAIASNGNSNVCAIFDDGQTRCQNSDTDLLVNLTFPAPNNYPAKHISSVESDKYCIVLENSAVFCGSLNSFNNGTGWDQLTLPADKIAVSVHIRQGGYYQTNSDTMCIVFTDGNASCRGSNNYGQVGNGDTSSTYNFYPVYFPQGISSEIQTMATAQYSSCALFDNGSVYCWGLNNEGQLGDGTDCNGNTFENNCNGNGAKPIIYDPVIMPSGQSAIALWTTDSSSDEGYCTLLTNGGVWCWGNGNGVVPNNGTGYYIDTNGYFVKPGNRDWDSDGIWNTQDNCAAGIPNWTSNPSIDADQDGCIDASEDTDDDGDGYSDMNEASCGTDPSNSSDIPLDPDGDGICNAFDSDDDNDGVLDSDDAFPNDSNGFVQLSLGDGFQSGQPEDNVTLGNSGTTACAILSDNSLRCWGDNERGQIGDGTRGTSRYTPTNISLPGGKTPVSISTSSQYNSNTICATMDDGSLYCWGNNEDGQIGAGSKCTYGSYIDGCNGYSGVSSPTKVSLPLGLNATAVSVGEKHACAILSDNSVWCWGSNYYGQLGVGNSSNTGNWRFTPTAVTMPVGVSATAIALGLTHTCMVVSDGRAFCWGEGDDGRLGHGSTSDEVIPAQVSGSSSYVSISVGEYHSCAITTIGTVQCWGVNWDGQLGDGSGTYGGRSFPADVSLPIGTIVTSLSSGEKHNCVVTSSMSLYCWGEDGNNRLNTEYECTNDFTNGCYNNDRHTPALSILPSGRNAIAVIAGDEWTCLIIDNGGVYCFGDNSRGELGNGSTDGNGPNYVAMPVGISPQTNDRDIDHDGVFNNEDDCMDGETGWTSNTSTDNDSDGCQDSSEDLDDDNDFLNDTDEATLGTNSTDPDTDDDGYLDGLDDFPLDGSEWLDTDADGIGNNADADDDNDGWSDSAEYYCQTDSLNGTDIPGDNDGDGNCDYTDTDDDNDGTPDSEDDFPFDSGADTDTDGDGMPNTLVANYTGNLTEDFDDDNDGWNDTAEVDCGNDPLSNSSTPVDTDGDTFCDPIDVYPNDPSEWADTDGDGIGDNSDVFPLDGTEWTDTDGDGLGDNIDPDADNDGWGDSDEDLCLTDWLDSSSVPGDIDSDGICDALEQDLDNDGWSNANETLCGTDWQDVNSVPLDTDGDMICDLMDGDIDGDLIPNDQDLFPLNPLEWYDFDGDGIGDNTDPDDDNDGCMDVSDDLPFDPTECDDTDGDGTGNNVDVDDDGDGIMDVNDPFPLDGAATVDTDGDGLPDFLNGTSSTGLLEDNDDDNDGYNDSDDAFPLDLTEWLDTDGDGEGNNADVNDDGDNCPDVIDAFPLNPAECFDTDGDGIGNNADSDDDNDGWLDGTEMACGTSDPLNASSVPDDFDSDGVCDLMDFDDDNDSIVDASDAFPFDPCASVDTDDDGLPDELFFNCNTTLVEDWDDDNDGYNDTVDLFPQDANEWSDFDMDGFGDNMDTDDDGDMVPDDYDLFPLNSSEWADNDGDGIGDNADLDDDNDGTEDLDDDFPLTFGITTDTDGDGLPDNMTAGYNGTLSEDLDDDGDGVLDIYDQFPLDATEWSDTDLDGIGNNADSDDDGDGWSDNDEWICGTDTLDANDIPDDSDGDGICDSEDDEDLTTLTGRAEFYLKSPVTVWMALVGIIAGMIGGATSTSFRARKERNQLYNEMRDFTDSVRDNVDYTRPIPSQQISVTESRDSEIKKLVDQGYSEEVAEALIESQR